MVTKEWVAIHRKHHAKVETDEDPHSPQTRGIDTVLWKGAELYRDEAKNADTLDKYGQGTPDDWLERNVYARFSWQGVGLMLAVDVALFGPLGLTLWAVQMAWIPFFAAGVVNGIGHYWSYRNFAANDTSRNIVPWGILVGGEELHNNHHAYGSSAKFSSRWWEFDLGWVYVRTLAALRLATIRKVAPRLRFAGTKSVPDLVTLQAVITHRYAVATHYARTLKRPLLRSSSTCGNGRSAASRSVLTCRASRASSAGCRPSRRRCLLPSARAWRLRWPPAERCRASTRCGRNCRRCGRGLPNPRAAACAAAGLVPACRDVRHRIAGEILVQAQGVRVSIGAA